MVPTGDNGLQLRVYADDGSGGFEGNPETLVADLTNFAPTAGVQTILLPDDDANLRVAHGAPRICFVVAEMAAPPPVI